MLGNLAGSVGNPCHTNGVARTETGSEWCDGAPCG